MANRESNIDSMVNDYQTTYRTEYTEQEIKPVVKTLYKDKKRSPKHWDIHGRYTHTLMYWKDAPAPLSTMIERKPVVRTNPNIVQPTYVKQPDLELDEVRRTRPRLVMTPAVSMDDVDDVQRFVLLKDIYSTSFMREFADNSDKKKLRAPLRGKYAPASSVLIEKYKQPLVSPEWRNDSVSWDRRQLRSLCDATKTFWLHGKNK